ncbi:hypothetical protein HanRHA438_Chr03g0112831 [Helianthus annuus]|nr:hypothetical protein HanHA300_Chr03g0084991 [Helianthus annuus]KAJ0607415.1 hypothetical protein HanHA89_Chr03g0096511 [Helianthus annuus]KAJ0767471.1 hypothetical protein HanLR1_Chr03g0089791 [Helianthus annuus]KAJ0773304.1 hypothetical protein HanOQP8_Chr03g0097731 [Helianthus annuus]KAJ0934899.1 hypothetical protein HanRHA438_Chr03g0112831 [Helianthus annuus]
MGPACFGALTSKKGTEKKFEGRIPLEKFGQFAETEDVIAEPVQVQPASVNAAQINSPINAMVAEEHDVQGAAEDEPETEILTINSDDEGIEIMCDSGDDEELPLENEVDIVFVTEKMGNPPSNLPVSNKEPPNEDPKDPDSLPVKRKRRDPRLGMYVEQNKDQPMNDAEDDDGLYDFDFEKNVTDTTTATEDIFEFDVYTQRMNVEIPTADTSVPTSVSDPIIVSTPSVTTTPAGPSGVIHEKPCSSSGKRPEEPLRMMFDEDSSDDDDFISMRELKKRLVVLEQDSIHKDSKIIQLEDTIVQKNQQIDQLQGDVNLLFNMVYDLRGKLEKKFGQECSDPTDVESRRKTAEDRARAFAKDDAERNAAMEHYFKRVTDPVADKVKAERIKKKREFVILKNKNLNPEDEDANATHHLMDVGETLYDKVGNRSGVVSWGFDHDRRSWWIKRKVGPVEWYKNPARFQTFTKVDLINLSKSPYVDDQPGGRGYLFFERLQREVARNFPSMHNAESIVTPAKGIRDPYTNKRMKIVHWPPTNKKRLFLWSRKFQKVL